MNANIDKSNYLPELAARIRAEHEGATAAMKRGCEHAINAGRLLIEAKNMCKHGEWLPWLAAHCGIPDRTARLYMRLARHAPELEAKSATVADLSIRRAIEALAPTPTIPSSDWDGDDWSEWADRQLNGPFTDGDLNTKIGWEYTKLMHQLGLPAECAICLDMQLHYDIPALRLCPSDQLEDGFRLAMLAAKGDASLSTKLECANAVTAGIHILLATRRIAGILFDELEHRYKISDERYRREFGQVRDALMANIEAKLVEAKAA
jgi:hypothetical protein